MVSLILGMRAVLAADVCEDAILEKNIHFRSGNASLQIQSRPPLITIKAWTLN